MHSTPRSLLQRLRQPSGPANAGDWAQFVDLYAPLLFHWARRLGLSEADARDLVQDVFIRLLQQLPTFEHDGQHRFRAWLSTMLRNCWRDRCRRRPSPVPLSPDQLDRAAVADPLDAWHAADDRNHLVLQALRIMRRDFQPATWQACWATVAEGRPAGEVAAELGLSVGAVYAAIARVLRRLRQEMAGFLDDDDFFRA